MSLLFVSFEVARFCVFLEPLDELMFTAKPLVLARPNLDESSSRKTASIFLPADGIPLVIKISFSWVASSKLSAVEPADLTDLLLHQAYRIAVHASSLGLTEIEHTGAAFRDPLSLVQHDTSHREAPDCLYP